MKRCSKCKKWKDESEFGKKRRCKDGLNVWCKKCSREYRRKYYRRHKKKVKSYLRYEDRHRVISGVKQKYCRLCKKWKAEKDFYRNRRAKDGLSWACRKCANKASVKSRRGRPTAGGK